MRLQGNVSTTTRRGLAVKGAIWQVLPIFDEISRVFEEARRMHLTAHSQRSQLNEAAPAQALAPGSSNTSIRQGSTRRSQAKPPTRYPVSIDVSTANIDEERPIESLGNVHQYGEAEGLSDYTDFEHHFSFNVNAGWQKLDYYHQLTDRSPIYRAAVFLHPRLKWRWFERY
jgi:hypothetical protein